MAPKRQFILGDYEFKIQYGASWIKIFYHHFTKIEDGFSTFDEVLSFNSQDKYSIIGAAKFFQKPDPNLYEFLLEYPQYDGFNRWKQEKFPTDETNEEGRAAAYGYENVSISWTRPLWGGLTLCYAPYCAALDGSYDPKNQSWFFVIGYMKTCTNREYQTSFPGPGETVNDVYLWMRINNIFLDHLCTRYHISPISRMTFSFLFFFTIKN